MIMTSVITMNIIKDSILLRAERKGYEYDRFYTITYTAADEVGNSTTGSTTVTVPHDMGHGHNN